MPTQERKPGLGTLALHAGQQPDPATTARAVPIYATSSYVFKYIRVSVGIEDIEDIKAGLDQALKASQEGSTA
jgi:O-acetylhomoserine/O-acetylserine sulfhydrylase-like pyridoxal-dependent enzyme